MTSCGRCCSAASPHRRSARDVRSPAGRVRPELVGGGPVPVARPGPAARSAWRRRARAGATTKPRSRGPATRSGRRRSAPRTSARGAASSRSTGSTRPRSTRRSRPACSSGGAAPGWRSWRRSNAGSAAARPSKARPSSRPREREVVTLLAEGLTNGELATPAVHLTEDRVGPRVEHPGQAVDDEPGRDRRVLGALRARRRLRPARRPEDRSDGSSTTTGITRSVFSW